jgi:uncharacterized repeat protein (TIGR01451 family)
MFKKLLSNLPFNPSLIDQVVFYSKRLRKEAAIRRIGFIFVALTLVIQIFATVSPTEASNQCSSNDIIRCGFKTREEAVVRCNTNAYGFKTIVEYYGMSCASLASAQTKTISTNAQGDQLFSMGRNPYQKRGEYRTDIPGAGTFWLRNMSSWGVFNSKVLDMKTPDGQPFMIMYDCGNIVIKGGYTPPAKPQPPASLKMAKVVNPTTNVKPGDQLEYTLAFTNTGGDAAFFAVNDQLPDGLEYTGSDYGSWIFERTGNVLKWYNNTPPFYTFGNTDVFGTPGFIKVRAKVKQNVASGTLICNRSWLSDVNTRTRAIQTWSERKVCNTVVIPCPSGTILDENGKCNPIKVPSAICSYLKPTKQSSRTKYSFETKAIALNGATIKSYNYDFGDGTKLVKSSSKDIDTVNDHDFKKTGTYQVSVRIESSVGQREGLTCKTSIAIKPEEKKPTPITSVEKKAKNVTQNIADANGTVANAGDVIEYTLITTNYGDGDENNKILQPENVADILEYADLDLSSLNGAVYEESSQSIAWNKPVTIKAGEKITKTFKISIKDPIPQTLRPNNQPSNSFDMKLTNVYGNTIEIKLPGTPLKTTEQITTTLPNTGPGEALLIGGALTTIVGYFFARSKLLALELEIVKDEYTTMSGGV